MTTRLPQLDRTRFFGRSEELERLARHSGEGHRIWLSGPSGSGRSRLAREYVKRHDDAIYIDLGEVTDPGEQVAIMSRSLPESAEGTELPERLGSVRMAFVKGDVASVAHHFPEATTLCRIDGRWADAEPFEIGALATEPALALLVDRVRRHDPGFDIDEGNRDALEELVAIAEGWPLVLEQLARRLALFTPAELVEQCQRGTVAWSGTATSKGWQAELERLSATEWEVVGAGLAMPGGFDAATMERVVKRPMFDVIHAIESLTESLILRRVDPRGSQRARFVVETTVAAPARANEDATAAGRRAVIDFWCATAHEHWRARSRDASRDASARLKREERNATHAYEVARRRDVDAAAQIAAAIVDTGRTSWSMERQEIWFDRLRELHAETTGEAHAAVTYALARGLRASRLYDEVVELLRPVVGTTEGLIDVLVRLELGWSLRLIDAFDEARELFVGVRDDAPSELRASRADAYLGVAQDWITKLSFGRAKEELVHALALASEIGDDQLLVRARQAQMSVTLTAGDFEASLVHATAILRELDDDADPRRVAGAHLQICDIVLEMGDLEATLEQVVKAEELLADRDFSRLSGYCDYVRAKVALLKGAPEEALRLLTAASSRFGEDKASFLLNLIEEVARTMANRDAIRVAEHDDLVERSRAYWAPLGSAAALLMIACRRYAGVARDEDDEALETIAAEADESGMVARHATALALMGEDRTPRGFDGQIVMRMFPKIRDEKHLVIGRDGRWFQVGGGEKVEIAKRKALPELLVAIARADGAALDPYELAEAGWPGEKLHPETAKNRVYVAVHALRKLGLAELIRTEGGGYALADGVNYEMENG